MPPPANPSPTPKPRSRKRALKVLVRRQLRRVLRRLAASRTPLWRQLRLSLGLGLAMVVAVNVGVREAGGKVHLLSLVRLGERARALTLYAAHRLGCRCDDKDVPLALRAAALRHRVPFHLALSVARTESGLQHQLISGTGAMGVMQLMPDTARALGVADPFDVEENVDAGVRYLKQLLDSYHGNLRRALAAYNAGPGRIPRKGPLILSEETRAYVAKIRSRM